MSDNFDVHEWNKNRYLSRIQENLSYLEKLAVDLSQKYPKLDFEVKFPDTDSRRIETRGSQSDLADFGDKMHGKKFGEYEVFHMDYDDRKDTVRIIKSSSVTENSVNELDSLEETINFVIENIEGYSDYFPGGKTKGLDNDTLSTILMQIIKDTEEDGKQLDESKLCKRGRNYLAARKRAGEKSSAYLSGRAVKVCKGQIKGSDGKKKKSY